MSSAEPALKKYQLFIDGQWVDSESGKTFNTPNPATGEPLAEVAEGGKADIDKAVAAARRAFEGKWSKLSARDRGRLLYKLSQLIENIQRSWRHWRLPITASRSKSRFTLTCRRWLRTSSTSPVGPRRSKARRFRFRARCSTTPCASRSAF